MRFFVGIHQPADAHRFDRAFISVNRLWGRKKPIEARSWIMDSGAFTTVNKHGDYPDAPEIYAAEIKRWAGGGLLAAVAQDYMCEPFVLERCGRTVGQHQAMTIARYDALVACDTGGVYIMPVLQGYAPEDYLAHLRSYGDRLAPGAWVGVGSVCKRNAQPGQVEVILRLIKAERPDLRLHGFGLKRTALESPVVRELLDTSDSMAWSFAARYEGRNANDWREAQRYSDNIDRLCAPRGQLSLFNWADL